MIMMTDSLVTCCGMLCVSVWSMGITMCENDACDGKYSLVPKCGTLKYIGTTGNTHIEQTIVYNTEVFCCHCV